MRATYPARDFRCNFWHGNFVEWLGHLEVLTGLHVRCPGFETVQRPRPSAHPSFVHARAVKVASGPPVVLTKFGAGVSVVRKSARGHIHELQSGAHGGSRSLSEQIGDMIDARCLHMHGFMTAHDGRPAYTLYMV
eukprot:6176987-Pleurochrysis_carterae.AAC.1